MQASRVAAGANAEEGRSRIDWARRHMPILRGLEKEFSHQRPFDGLRVSVTIHLEAKTAYLAEVLRAGGAEVAVTGSNSESTKDDVAAALAERGLHVYARTGASEEEMAAYLEAALELNPHIVIDDGGDAVERLHNAPAQVTEQILGACEETTSGVQRAQQLAERGELRFPVLLINDARCKYLFDNVHGTGQSVWDAIMRSTNLAVAGKSVVIVGFGWCGRGCALRARGLGARVIVCEVDPVKAADALLSGYEVAPLLDACEQADVVVTATGVAGTLKAAHFKKLRNGAFLANAGHFRNEVDVSALAAMSTRRSTPRESVTEYELGRRRSIYLLGDGNIVNIACGDGHPAEIMDTSFALQALSARYLVEHAAELPRAAIPVPEDIDRAVAHRKLETSGIRIDRDDGRSGELSAP